MTAVFATLETHHPPLGAVNTCLMLESNENAASCFELCFPNRQTAVEWLQRLSSAPPTTSHAIALAVQAAQVQQALRLTATTNEHLSRATQSPGNRWLDELEAEAVGPRKPAPAGALRASEEARAKAQKYVEQGQLAKAGDVHFQQGVALLRLDPASMVAAGWFRQAIALQASLEGDEGQAAHAYSWIMLGTCLENAGRFPEALECQQAALKVRLCC